MKRIAAFAFLFSLVSAPAFAEQDAASFLKQYDSASSEQKQGYENAALTMYLGIGWAESGIETLSKNRARLFCQPSQLTLTGVDVIGHMHQFLNSHPKFETEPYGLVVMMAIMELWPCPRPSDAPKQEN